MWNLAFTLSHLSVQAKHVKYPKNILSPLTVLLFPGSLYSLDEITLEAKLCIHILRFLHLKIGSEYISPHIYSFLI